MAPAGLGALEIENERLRSELDTLRQHATGTPTVRLRELNERQVGACRPVSLAQERCWLLWSVQSQA